MEVARQKWLMVEGQCSTTLATTFKTHAMQKEIQSLKDEMGTIQTAWKEITDIARRHFIALVGTKGIANEDDIYQQSVGRSHCHNILRI